MSSENAVTVVPNANSVVVEYLMANAAEFRELAVLRQKGWDSAAGDRHFQNQRNRADQADNKVKAMFFSMMCEIGGELNDATSALSLLAPPGRDPAVLDLCMAPGGFTASVLKRNQNARVRGISLPVSKGGHDILLPRWRYNPRIRIDFLDITMLAAEMGVTNIPPQHPDFSEFVFRRPYQGEEFDLVFCDGQVLRTHPRASYREECEPCRLLTSQLVMALQRIRRGGTLVMLLHKVDAWDSVTLLHAFNKFSSVELFKPRKKHAIRSSFYLIAKEVQPQSADALRAVDNWKKQWAAATFGDGSDYAQMQTVPNNVVDSLLAEFGPRLVSLGKPIWVIHADALRNAPFIRPGNRTQRLRTTS